MNDRLAGSLISAMSDHRYGSIYFVECEGYVKIGIAQDVKGRLIQMQIGCPFKLNLIRHYRHRRADWAEKVIHDSFSKYRERGEWFLLPPDKLLKLKSVVKRKQKWKLGKQATITPDPFSGNTARLHALNGGA